MENKLVQVKLQVNTITNNITKQGSDIYVAFKGTGECVNGCMFDYSSTNYLIPKLDSQQDVALTGFLQRIKINAILLITRE